MCVCVCSHRPLNDDRSVGRSGPHNTIDRNRLAQTNERTTNEGTYVDVFVRDGHVPSQHFLCSLAARVVPAVLRAVGRSHRLRRRQCCCCRCGRHCSDGLHFQVELSSLALRLHNVHVYVRTYARAHPQLAQQRPRCRHAIDKTRILTNAIGVGIGSRCTRRGARMCPRSHTCTRTHPDAKLVDVFQVVVRDAHRRVLRTRLDRFAGRGVPVFREVRERNRDLRPVGGVHRHVEVRLHLFIPRFINQCEQAIVCHRHATHPIGLRTNVCLSGRWLVAVGSGRRGGWHGSE